MVTFPEIQDFMEHERWGECVFCQAIEGHECPDSTYMVPESLYDKVFGEANVREILKHIGETFIVEGQEAVLVGYAEDTDMDCIVGFDSDTFILCSSCSMLPILSDWLKYGPTMSHAAVFPSR